jgi:hypothetical protein
VQQAPLGHESLEVVEHGFFDGVHGVLCLHPSKHRRHDFNRAELREMLIESEGLADAEALDDDCACRVGETPHLVAVITKDAPCGTDLVRRQEMDFGGLTAEKASPSETATSFCPRLRKSARVSLMM